MTHRQHGFTFLEVIIVVAILAVLAIAGGVTLFGIGRKVEVEAPAQTIAELLRNAQSRAKAGDEFLQWGVYFDNPYGAGGGFARLCKGSTYSACVANLIGEAVTLPTAVEFSDPGDGGVKVIRFEISTGKIAGRGESGEPWCTEASGSAKDDDGDGLVNDGCPVNGSSAETGAQCMNATDDDPVDDPNDRVNDGCPVDKKGTQDKVVLFSTRGEAEVRIITVSDQGAVTVTKVAAIPKERPLQVASSTYTGNGTSQTITVGFQPDLVIVKRAAANYAVWRSSAMSGDASAYFSYAVANVAGRITGFTTSPLGFSVGSDAEVNSSIAPTTYYYVAVRDPTGRYLKVGSYSGTGAIQSIAGVGFRPSLVLIKQNGLAVGAFRPNTLAPGSDGTYLFDSGAAVTTAITSLDSNGFTLGAHANVNATGANNHFFIAFSPALDSIETGTYSGNGSDNISISTGFQPLLVLVRRDSQEALARWGSTGDESGPLSLNAWGVDYIQALEALGFQVGISANSSGFTYHWFALR